MNSRMGSLGAPATPIAERNGHPPASADGPAPLREDGAPAGVVIVDAQSRILHLSGHAFAAGGSDAQVAVGGSIDQVLPPEALPMLWPRLHAALGGAPQSYSYRTPETGQVCVVQLVPVPDGDGIGTVVAILVIELINVFRH